MVLVCKEIALESMKESDKKAFSKLFGLVATCGKGKAFDVPLMASKTENGAKNAITVEQLSKVFYALNQSFDDCLDLLENEKTSKDGEKFLTYSIRYVEKIGEKSNVLATVAPLKTDLKRESSKKTTEKNEQKKANAKKEADDLNKACKMKILSSIEKIAPSYAKFDNKKLSDFMTAIEKILNENF